MREPFASEPHNRFGFKNNRPTAGRRRCGKSPAGRSAFSDKRFSSVFLFLVTIARLSHLVPSRTQKLRASTARVLRESPAGE